MSPAADGGPVMVTLIEGGDPTLVAEALRRIIDELVGDEDRSLVLEDYSGDEVDLAAVADACATPPFLTSRRVVVVRDVGKWKTEEVAPLLSYLENPLDTTALVLVAGGGQTPAKLATAAKAHGQAVSTQVDSRATAEWVEKRIRRSGVGLDGTAIRALIEHLGEDPGRLVPIIDLLEAAFPPGERLRFEDIEPYLGQAGSVTPWAFTDSIDSGQVEAALTSLHRLLEGGDRHPLVVLAILHRHVTSLMRVDHPGIRSEADAALAMGIAKGRSTYPAKKALKSAQSWGSANVAEAVGLVADAELDLKGQSAWPEAAVLEVLVARLCRLARGGAGARRPAAAHS
jgi:DNA polymerase III subunit delta